MYRYSHNRFVDRFGSAGLIIAWLLAVVLAHRFAISLGMSVGRAWVSFFLVLGQLWFYVWKFIFLGERGRRNVFRLVDPFLRQRFR